MRAEQAEPDNGSFEVRESKPSRRVVAIKINLPPVDPELTRLIAEFQKNCILNGFNTSYRDTTQWYDK